MHLCPRWCIIFTPPFVSWRRICTQGKIRCTEVQMIASVKRLEVTWDCMSLKRSAMMRLKEKLTSFAFARHCFSNLLISNMSHGYIIQRLEYFAENLSPHINPKLTKFQAAEIGNSANLFRENRKSSGCFGSPHQIGVVWPMRSEIIKLFLENAFHRGDEAPTQFPGIPFSVCPVDLIKMLMTSIIARAN